MVFRSDSGKGRQAQGRALKPERAARSGFTLTETAAFRSGTEYCEFRFETGLLRDCHKGRKPAEKCGFRLAGEAPFQ